MLSDLPFAEGAVLCFDSCFEFDEASTFFALFGELDESVALEADV